MRTPRICLNMIVRNEAAVIERCLASVRPYIDCWAIADTGSTDGTQVLVRNYLADLPGELIERPWVDFATNRNEALALARSYGEYAFFIDADDVFEAEPGSKFGDLGAPLYAVQMHTGGTVAWVPALARLDLDWSWRGVLHEVLTCAENPLPQRLPRMRILVVGDGARSAAGVREKYARDAEVLRAALEREPQNGRYRICLAHSLREAGDYVAALAAYREFIAAGGSQEEIYFSKLMLAVLGEQVGWSDQQVLSAYRDAYLFRPQRAETMSRLARYHLRRGRFAQARDCALNALAAPPPRDTQMVDYAAWSWKPRDDLASALLELGDVAGAVRALGEMLADRELPPVERARIQRDLDRLAARHDTRK